MQGEAGTARDIVELLGLTPDTSSPSGLWSALAQGAGH